MNGCKPVRIKNPEKYLNSSPNRDRYVDRQEASR